MRRRVVVLLFVGLAATTTLCYWSRSPIGADSHTPMAPARVIMGRAVVIDQGVHVEWIKSQAGTYPIAGYVIERSRGSGDFERISRVESIFSEFVDSEGRAGDKYRVIAEDGRQTPGQSAASEQVVAAPANPGSAVIVASSPGALSTLTTIQQAKTANAKIEILKNALSRMFTDFDAALTNNDIATAVAQLTALQSIQRQALALWPQLSSDQKALLADICTSQVNMLEASMPLLPENTHLDTMLVLAGCNAIQAEAE